MNVMHYQLEYYESGAQELIENANGTPPTLEELVKKIALSRSARWKKKFKKWAATLYKWGYNVMLAKR